MATEPKKIRLLYEEYGAEDYYRKFGGDYENPHFPEIETLLREHWPQLKVQGTVLDLAAGGGEVSRVLMALDHSDLEGCDPYTGALYEKQTGKSCLPLSFKDIVKAGLPRDYDLAICSFALHLCPEKDLFTLCWQIFQRCPRLVVITPHKRPALEQLPNVRLEWESDTKTEKGKMVRLRVYVGMEAGC